MLSGNLHLSSVSKLSKYHFYPSQGCQIFRYFKFPSVCDFCFWAFFFFLSVWNALQKADHITPQVEFLYCLEYNVYF